MYHWGDSDCTWTNFRSHFVHGDKERLRLLTSTTAEYHGAHATISLPGDSTGVATATWLILPGNQFVCNNLQLGYCWTHGLTKNHDHTCATCSHPDTGHQVLATLDKQMGGSGRLFSDGNRPSHRNHGTPPAPTRPPTVCTS